MFCFNHFNQEYNQTVVEKFSEKNDFFKTLAEKLSTKTYEHFAESFLVVFYNTCITLK